ncbi:hypothetical protein QYF36_015715 [Acer negundo]|nr:hypothetical protein QYF36_015715 [Acer negundo]
MTPTRRKWLGLWLGWMWLERLMNEFVMRLNAAVLLVLVSLVFPPFCLWIRSLPTIGDGLGLEFDRFSEAPEYRNGRGCPVSADKRVIGLKSSCDPSLVHVAMTLDSDKRFWVFFLSLSCG